MVVTAADPAILEQRPLTGIRVVDFSHIVAGPVCTMWLADAGAEVIKIESATGDRARERGGIKRVGDRETSGYYTAYNRGKKSVVLNLKAPAGRRAAERLIAESDIVVQNFGSGAMERLGLGLEDLRARHPRLITVSISLYGTLPPSHPLSARLGLAIVAEAESGIAGQRGEPIDFGFPLGDQASAQEAFAGVMTALYARERTGRGRHVDVSMVAALVRMNANAISSYSLLGAEEGSLRTAVYGYYPTRDGHVAAALSTDDQFARFVEAIGRPELAADPDFAGFEARNSRTPEVRQIIEKWSLGRSTEEAIEILTESRIPCGRARTSRMIVEDPLSSQLGLLATVEALGSEVSVPAAPLGLPSGRHVPALGEHTAAVLEDVARLSPDELRELGLCEGADS